MEESAHIYINIDSTTRCNRGCRHCQSDSKPQNGTNFNCRKTELLFNRLSSVNTQTIICLTGGGEPLMNKELPQIAKMISEWPFLSSLSLVTSGFLKNKEEKNRLAETLQNIKPEKFVLNLSFHQFSKNYRERFKETVEFLLETDLKGFKIKITIIKTNDNIVEELEDIFDEMDIWPYLVDWRDWNDIATDLFSEKVYGEHLEKKLISLAYFFPCFYFYLGKVKNKVILTHMQTLSPYGRAAKYLKDECIILNPNCRIFVDNDDEINLRLDARGNWYYSSCLHESHPHMKIGTLDEDMPLIIERNKKFARDILNLILADRRMLDYEHDICSLCSKIKAEMDARA